MALLFDRPLDLEQQVTALFLNNPTLLRPSRQKERLFNRHSGPEKNKARSSFKNTSENMCFEEITAQLHGRGGAPEIGGV